MKNPIVADELTDAALTLASKTEEQEAFWEASRKNTESEIEAFAKAAVYLDPASLLIKPYVFSSLILTAIQVGYLVGQKHAETERLEELYKKG